MSGSGLERATAGACAQQDTRYRKANRMALPPPLPFLNVSLVAFSSGRKHRVVRLSSRINSGVVGRRVQTHPGSEIRSWTFHSQR